MEGILINPINKGESFEQFLLSLHVPVVCIGNQVSGKITTVQVNEMVATMDAVKHIVSKDYENSICLSTFRDERDTKYLHT